MPTACYHCRHRGWGLTCTAHVASLSSSLSMPTACYHCRHRGWGLTCTAHVALPLFQLIPMPTACYHCRHRGWGLTCTAHVALDPSLPAHPCPQHAITAYTGGWGLTCTAHVALPLFQLIPMPTACYHCRHRPRGWGLTCTAHVALPLFQLIHAHSMLSLQTQGGGASLALHMLPSLSSSTSMPTACYHCRHRGWGLTCTAHVALPLFQLIHAHSMLSVTADTGGGASLALHMLPSLSSSSSMPTACYHCRHRGWSLACTAHVALPLFQLIHAHSMLSLQTQGVEPRLHCTCCPPSLPAHPCPQHAITADTGCVASLALHMLPSLSSSSSMPTACYHCRHRGWSLACTAHVALPLFQLIHAHSMLSLQTQGVEPHLHCTCCPPSLPAHPCTQHAIRYRGWGLSTYNTNT